MKLNIATIILSLISAAAAQDNPNIFDVNAMDRASVNATTWGCGGLGVNKTESKGSDHLIIFYKNVKQKTRR